MSKDAIALYNKLKPLITSPGFQPLDEQIHIKLIGLEISKTYPHLGELIGKKGLVAAIKETIPPLDQENVYKIILAILNVIQNEYERSISGGRRRGKSRRRGSRSRKQTKRSKRRRSV
jgi:hypothetical protein